MPGTTCFLRCSGVTIDMLLGDASVLQRRAPSAGRRYFASQGFYVVADYQTLNGGPADNVADKESFMTQWVALVTKILQDAPEVQGKLLLDLINEPDG